MKTIGMFILATAIGLSKAWAGDDPPTALTNKEAIDLVQSHADYLWTLVAAALVFFMQAGFAMVEAGFTRAKNAINIMMKNLMDFSMGTIAYWAIGFGLMFGISSTEWFGTSGFFLSDFSPDGDPWVLAFWMFQVVFCATAAPSSRAPWPKGPSSPGIFSIPSSSAPWSIPSSGAGLGEVSTRETVGWRALASSILPVPRCSTQ